MNTKRNSSQTDGSSVPSRSRRARLAPTLVQSRDLAFRDIARLVSRGLLIIRARWLSGAVAAVVLGGLAAYALLSHPGEKTAQTVLLAQGTLDKVIGTQGSNTSNDALGLQLENTLRNHLSVMEGRSFQSRLIESFSPAERTAIARPYLAPGKVADDEFFHILLDSKVTVERERGREFFTINVKHRDAATALMVAGRFGSEYLSLVQTQFKDANKEGFTMLEAQAAGLRKEIAKAEDDRLDFRKKNQIMSLVDSQGILAERLKRVDAARTDARILRIRIETELDQVKASMAASEFPWDNAYLANYGTNVTLHKELDALSNLRAVLATRYGSMHTKMRDVDESMAGITADIRHNFEVARNDLEIQLKAAQKTEKDFQEEFDQGFGKSIETEKLATRSDIFATDIEVKKQNLLLLEKRIADAGLYSQLPVDFMQIAEPAFIVRPFVSTKTIEIALSIIAALVFFVSTPLIIDFFDPRIKSTSDPESLLQVRLIGAIPALKKRTQRQPAHVMQDGPESAAKDALGDVIGELDLISPVPFPKTILVTSTLAKEGKSFLVSNLAAGYIARDKRVVILDLDLRRPSQQILQGAKGTGGFLPWFRAGMPMVNPLEAGAVLGFQELENGAHLIPAGGEERGANHQLASSQMAALLNELKGRFDVILIDTPPAGVFQDALQLGLHADERILVSRIARAPISHVRRVIATFEDAGAPITGIVLNGLIPSDAEENLSYAYRAGGRAAYYLQKVPSKTSPATENGALQAVSASESVDSAS